MTTNVSTKSLEARLTDKHGVAKMLGCSWNSVYRMSDAGKMPRPVRIGRMVRWRIEEIEQWIHDGCPNLRRSKQTYATAL